MSRVTDLTKVPYCGWKQNNIMHITQRTYLNSNGSKITNTFRV